MNVSFQASRLSVILQSRLATVRNANSEAEVDESMLHLGLFAYPVLQAADVLLYKSATSARDFFRG